MRLENVMMAGYNQCPAFKWLHENGGIEGRFEMQTVVTSNQEAVYEALNKVKERWMSNEFGAKMTPQPVQQPEAAEANVQVSQDSNMGTALG